MLGRIRSQLTYANVMATVAVFVALGGGAYAAVNLPANSVGTKQLKKGAVTNKKIGKNAVTGAKVKNGSLRGTDFAAGQLPAGPQGPQGVQGVRGEPGPFSDLLPSGRTLRGEFGITGTGVTNNYGDISFGFRLASDPTPNVIEEGGASTAACPGTATDPEAAPGNLCIYVGSTGNVGTDPDDIGVFTGDGVDCCPNTDRYGAVLYATSVTQANEMHAYGTWAVTAP